MLLETRLLTWANPRAMNNREVAMEFLRCFCAGDVTGLSTLLAEDLRFRGPFYQFSSRDEYVECLKHAPPEPCGYRVFSVTESEECVSVYYNYEKRDGALIIAQLFTFKNHKISGLQLVFDGRGFP